MTKKSALPRGRPRREDVEAIDRRLADAALSMVLRHGSAVTMNAVIEASGLSRKTVYARHANKSALLIAVIRHLLDFDQEPLTIAPHPNWKDSLREFISDSLREICQPESVALRRLLMLDPAYIADVRSQIEMIVVRRYMDPLMLLLKQLIQDEKIPPHDVGRSTEALTNLMLAESHKRFFLQGDADDEAALDNHASYLTDLFCHGIMGQQLDRAMASSA